MMETTTGSRRWICTVCRSRMILEESCISGILPNKATVCDVCGNAGSFELAAGSSEDKWSLALMPMLRAKAAQGDGLAHDAADAIEDMRRMMWSCILELECLDAHTIPTQARNVLRQFFPQWMADQEGGLS